MSAKTRLRLVRFCGHTAFAQDAYECDSRQAVNDLLLCQGNNPNTTEVVIFNYETDAILGSLRFSHPYRYVPITEFITDFRAIPIQHHH